MSPWTDRPPKQQGRPEAAFLSSADQAYVLVASFAKPGQALFAEACFGVSGTTTSREILFALGAINMLGGLGIPRTSSRGKGLHVLTFCHVACVL
jgi:hypothetical protein